MLAVIQDFGDVITAARPDDSIADGFSEQCDREHRDQDAVDRAFDQSKRKSYRPVEFFETNAFDPGRYHARYDPDGYCRSQEQDEHRQKAIPWRIGLDLLREWLAKIDSNPIADAYRSY